VGELPRGPFLPDRPPNPAGLPFQPWTSLPPGTIEPPTLLYGLARRVGAKVRFILCSAHSALDQVAPQHPLVSGRIAKPAEPGELETLLASASSSLEATVH
jgi:hypothetical protein